MAFQIIRDSVMDNILIPGEQDQFRTVGHPLPLEGSEALLKNKRAVAFYYAEGDLTGGQEYEPYHDMIFYLELMVAANAQADLKVLEKEFPEALQNEAYSIALSNMQAAEYLADRLMDDLIAIVYQLVMKAENDELAIDRIEPSSGVRVHNRLITKIEKFPPESPGEQTVMKALLTLKCQAEEDIEGEEPLGEIGAGDSIIGEYEPYPPGAELE